MVDEDPNPEWEMIAETEESASPTSNHNVVIFPGASATEIARVRLNSVSGDGNNMIRGRPRSATIGGPGDTAAAVNDVVTMSRNNSSCEIDFPKGSFHKRAALRRCASTPDLMMSDNAHEVIVEDESDDEGVSSDDAELVEVEYEESDEESFEVLSSGNHQDATAKGDEDNDEPVMIMDEEESGTLVSTPSVGTSSWTMASAPSTGVWGMTKSPSFADILSKNLEKDNENSGVFGKDKAATEAKLRDSHRRHHLRVRTKPKFIVSTESDSSPKMIMHAHSTGDLTKILSAVEEGHESSLGQGNRNRGAKKHLSAMMEEDDEDGDYVIGRGSGTPSGGFMGGGGGVLGDTDAMDYYQRKEHGSKSSQNKKKERPDEAKRREIIMHKKEMQRKKQQASQNGGGAGGNDKAEGGKKKKTKNDKGFGGKKERRTR